MAKFAVVATGGTFDEIHIGHIALLSKAFEVGKKVIIGVSSDEFATAKKGKANLNHNYQQRVGNLKAAIEKKFGKVDYEIAKLDNEFGPAVLSGDVLALVASAETAAKGKRLNELRAKKGLQPVEIVVVEMIKAEDGRRISSTRIRAGEIDRNGRLLKAGQAGLNNH